VVDKDQARGAAHEFFETGQLDPNQGAHRGVELPRADYLDERRAALTKWAAYPGG